MNPERMDQALDSFVDMLNRHADQMISILKESCHTYGDVDQAILRIRRDITWRDQLQFLPLIDAAQKILDDEKSRLLVAGDSLRVD